ncbi:hypothetical protein SESBI_00311 [Sesbania bispinosa]|nr:hypothetical protein SESBI_00311 [Sesbania bispinosa]
MFSLLCWVYSSCPWTTIVTQTSSSSPPHHRCQASVFVAMPSAVSQLPAAITIIFSVQPPLILTAVPRTTTSSHRGLRPCLLWSPSSTAGPPPERHPLHHQFAAIASPQPGPLPRATITFLPPADRAAIAAARPSSSSRACRGTPPHSSMEEVQINTSQATECNATETRRNIRIVVVGNEFEKIDELSRLMSKEDRDAFNRRYGRILDLLAIRVKTKSLSALAQFWNTDLRCFELPNLDMVPTIEEYGLMVRLPVKEKEVVYQYKGRYVDEKKIAKLIGLLPNQLKFEKRGSILGLRRTFLEDRLKVLAEQGHWKHFKITLALTIYGLILFPFTSDMVDQAAMDVFFQFEENGANPVPAILADTFLSMMVCHQKKGGSLRCCSHMLYVWIMTHLYARHTMGPSPDPLRDFDSVPTKDFDARGWNEEFSHTKDNQITWGLCGLHAIYCSQTTQMHTNQACRRALGGASFLYGTDDVGLLIEEIKSAWGDIKWKGEKELGKTRVIASPEYKEWRKARGVPPPPTPMEAVHNEASPATLSQIITTMTSEAERMKAQMTFMEEKADAADLRITILEAQCRKKDKEIKDLQNDCEKACADADQARNAKRPRKGKEGKEDSTSAEMKKMQDHLELMEKEVLFTGKIINQPSKVYPRHPYRTRYQVRMMEDLTDLTLENEELKKEIKQMRAEMDKMSESMRIMEKQNAEGTSQ